MVFNARHQKTMASVHPQYNLLNFGYQLYVQIFERLESGEVPDYIKEYRETNGITDERLLAQKKLIADLLDGLFAKEYTRDPSMEYLRKCMQDCNWYERFDWQAMAVFDMLASQATLASYFSAIADLASAQDIEVNGLGELREIVKRQSQRAVDLVV